MKNWLSHPFVVALLLGLSVVLLAFSVPFWHWLRGEPLQASTPTPTASATPAPWVLQRRGEAVAVLGLQLPGSTLGQVQSLWGDNVQLAVMARRGEPGALEAYVERVDAGGVLGRLVLVFEQSPTALLALQQGAAKAEGVDGVVWRHVLRGEQRQQLAAAPVVGLSFVIATRVDAPALRQRFGAPTERWLDASRQHHWLYPASGLALVLGEGGKPLVQVVAPRAFDARLRAPLVAAGAQPLPADAPD